MQDLMLPLERELATFERLAEQLRSAALTDSESDPARWGRKLERAHLQLAAELSRPTVVTLGLLQPFERFPYKDVGTLREGIDPLDPDAPPEGALLRLDGPGGCWPPPPLAVRELRHGSAPSEFVEQLVHLAHVRALRLAAWVEARCKDVKESVLPRIAEAEGGTCTVELGGGRRTAKLTARDRLLLQKLLVDNGSAGGPDDNTAKKARDRLLERLPELRAHVRSESGQYRLNPSMRDRIALL